MISQIAAVTVNVVALAPEPDHGDTEANPIPDPSASNRMETAAATNAPAMIADHVTADDGASVRGPSPSGVGPIDPICSTISGTLSARTRPTG